MSTWERFVDSVTVRLYGHFYTDRQFEKVERKLELAVFVSAAIAALYIMRGH